MNMAVIFLLHWIPSSHVSAHTKREYVFILPVGFLFSSFILRLMNVYGAEGGPPIARKRKSAAKMAF